MTRNACFFSDNTSDEDVFDIQHKTGVIVDCVQQFVYYISGQ